MIGRLFVVEISFQPKIDSNEGELVIDFHFENCPFYEPRVWETILILFEGYFSLKIKPVKSNKTFFALNNQKQTKENS